MGDPCPNKFPLWLKLVYSAFVCVLVPIYTHKYGWRNFLWFSDIALFGGLVALWLESPLIASMITVGVLVPEIVWNVSFLCRLILGVDFVGLAGYMFESDRPLYLRLLSLFHVPLPPLLVWMVYRMGYDHRALRFQIIFGWSALLLTYLLTDPSKNINWVFGPGTEPQHRLPSVVYLGIAMTAYLVVFYLPVHLVFRRLFSPAPKSRIVIDPSPAAA